MSGAGAFAPGDRLACLSLFYPMFNEEANIEEAARRALRILPKYADLFEVILVDDGSRDRTGAIADRLASADPRVRAIHHETNRGYGAALRSGISAARYDWIFYTDGDNQFDLEDLSLLLPLTRNHDCVTGYRVERKDTAIRKLNARIFNAAIELLFGLRLRDVDCAFKLYRRTIFDGIALESDGAMIDTEILAKARARGARIAEVGVRHFPRLAGSQSGARLSVILRAFRELLRLRGKLR
jgi:glycosyltransferase involved in cell wall biosynthesis